MLRATILLIPLSAQEPEHFRHTIIQGFSLTFITCTAISLWKSTCQAHSLAYFLLLASKLSFSFHYPYFQPTSTIHLDPVLFTTGEPNGSTPRGPRTVATSASCPGRKGHHLYTLINTLLF